MAVVADRIETDGLGVGLTARRPLLRKAEEIVVHGAVDRDVVVAPAATGHAEKALGVGVVARLDEDLGAPQTGGAAVLSAPADAPADGAAPAPPCAATPDSRTPLLAARKHCSSTSGKFDGETPGNRRRHSAGRSRRAVSVAPATSSAGVGFVDQGVDRPRISSLWTPPPSSRPIRPRHQVDDVRSTKEDNRR